MDVNGCLMTGSMGEYLLPETGSLTEIIQRNYVWLSKDVLDEEKFLRILRRGYYEESDREWLSGSLENFYPRLEEYLSTLPTTSSYDYSLDE